MAGVELNSSSLKNDANLVAYWRMEGNSNTTVGSFNGTDTSITYNTGNGQFGQGAGFNGSTSKIATSSNIGISGATARTIHCWVKRSTTTREALVGWGAASSGNQSFLEMQSSGGTSFLYFVGFSADVTSSFLCGDGNWHMLDFTYDGTNGRLYGDGILVGGPTAITLNTTNSVVTMGQEASSLFPYGGDLDDVAIFNRALSAAEIFSLWFDASKIPWSPVYQPRIDREHREYLYQMFSFYPGIIAFPPQVVPSNISYQPRFREQHFEYLFQSAHTFAPKPLPAKWVPRPKHTTPWTNRTKPSPATSYTARSKPTTTWINRIKPT